MTLQDTLAYLWNRDTETGQGLLQTVKGMTASAGALGRRQTRPFYDGVWLPQGATKKGPDDEIKSTRGGTGTEGKRERKRERLRRDVM